MSNTKARARAFVEMFRAMRQERDDLREDWLEAQHSLELVARQIGRALYGRDDDGPWLDDGLVGELTHVVDDYLDAKEALGIGPDERIGPTAWALEPCLAAHKARNAEDVVWADTAECANAVTINVLRVWSRDRIDRVARHLLGGAATPTASERTRAGEQETCATCDGYGGVCTVCGRPPERCECPPESLAMWRPCTDCQPAAQPAGPISDEYSPAAEPSAEPSAEQPAMHDGVQAGALWEMGYKTGMMAAGVAATRGIAPGADAWHDKAAMYRRSGLRLAATSAALLTKRNEARDQVAELQRQRNYAFGERDEARAAAVEADAEVDRLRAEVERLKEGPDEWRGWKAMCKQADGGGA